MWVIETLVVHVIETLMMGDGNPETAEGDL